jgi:hypothetical protein
VAFEVRQDERVDDPGKRFRDLETENAWLQKMYADVQLEARYEGGVIKKW